MELLEPALQVHCCETPREALRALVEGAPLRAAAWVGAAGEPVEAWPEGAPSAVDATDGVLRLPLEEGAGVLLLLPGEGAGYGVDAAALAPLTDAFTRLVRRSRRLREMEQEVASLRRRAEESEALHVLGLAANRSLDPDEVLDLVTRFTRTLLGAHYVTVSTREEGRVRTVAAVGLRSPEGLHEDDPLAARVIERGKPFTLGRGDREPTGEYALHDAEGMRTAFGVPLSLYGGTFGALVVGYRRAFDLDSRDTRLALTLAGHAAVAISNARLHRHLAERSRELERAYEELRWSAQAKERFFASMSHELRTPLNAILGFHSLLLEEVAGPLPVEQRSFVERAHRATQALLLLVNDVLDLSKIEAGKMELFVRPVTVSEIVHEALQTIQPMAAAKGIEARGPGWDELSVVLSTDADRVRQILLNLLSNAVKFAEKGRVEITVEVQEEWVEIRVADSGPGIEEESQERIFHEFEQIAGAAARAGTGLGLPISRKLARLLGGDLRVESRPGEGATFILRLPAHGPAEPGTPIAQG